MIIRPENQNDFDTIYQLVKTAFETAHRSDGHEQDFVNSLRGCGNYIPELSLVAERDGQIIGHIMLSKTYIQTDSGRAETLLLAPVAVAIEHRNKKIGAELILTAMQKAKDMGFTSVFLAGNPAYYTRFGFVPTFRYGITCNVDVPPELLDHIMVCPLTPDAMTGAAGVVKLT